MNILILLIIVIIGIILIIATIYYYKVQFFKNVPDGCYNCTNGLVACPNGIDYESFPLADKITKIPKNTPMILSRVPLLKYDNVSASYNLRGIDYWYRQGFSGSICNR